MTALRKCSVCGDEKPKADFPRHRTLCKPCNRAYAREYRKGKGYHLTWYATNKDRALAATRAWKAKNPNYAQEYYQRNKPKINAQQAENHQRAPWKTQERTTRRRRARSTAAPSWGDQSAIREVYALAKFMTEIMGEPYQVDHIVPLQSPLVCGLHVVANLQVLPASENKSKGNRLWPDMPELEYGNLCDSSR